MGSFKRHYSTNSSNLFGVENNKPIIFDSLEQGCEEIKYKFIGVSGVYKLTNKNDLTRFYIGSSNNLSRRMEEYNKLTKGLRTPHSLGELEISKTSSSEWNLEFIYLTSPQLSLVYEQYAIIMFKPTINSNLKVIPRINPQWGNHLDHAIFVIEKLLSLFTVGSDGYNRLYVFLQTFKTANNLKFEQEDIDNKYFCFLVFVYDISSPSPRGLVPQQGKAPQGTSKKLGGYLAGLIEGDGSIIVPKTTRNQKGKLLYPVVKITFVKKDAPLAIKIQDVISGGKIVHPKNSNYIDLLFQDLNSIQWIAVLLNGNMRTPKIEALYRLIDWLNAKYKDKPEIVKLGLDSSELDSNPWLAGFIEADGHFYCGFDLNSQCIANTVKCYMAISQKNLYKANSDLSQKDNSNLYIMEKIREFLDVKNVNQIKRIKSDYIELAYSVRTTKKSSCQILINYLNAYPLFSSKHQDFLDWSKAHHIRIHKKYKTLEGSSELLFLKNSMNTKRTQFNWDSLNNFYSLM